ncbi:MAG: hypothetical protein ACTSUO_08030 [Candidatus Thorarchaeota archaeon]
MSKKIAYGIWGIALYMILPSFTIYRTSWTGMYMFFFGGGLVLVGLIAYCITSSRSKSDTSSGW